MQWRNLGGGAEGGSFPRAQQTTGRKTASSKYFNDHKSEFVYTKRNTEHTHLDYLALILFVFTHLCIDVVQFYSKFASCHFAEKAKLRQP